MARLARGALDRRAPGPWALNYERAGIGEAVAEAVESLHPSLLVLRSTLAHLIPCVRADVGLVVADVHDAETFQARSLLVPGRPLGWPAGLLRVQAGRTLDRTVATADELWVPSQRERDYYRRVAPDTPVLVVPNGVDVPEELPEHDWSSPFLLLVGGFGYPPNEEAAVRLVEEILPQVRSHVPDASVVLVGRDLDCKLQRAWREQPVQWLGVVDDLLPLYRSARALVLAYGPSTETGTPLKVSEALANGLPVIAAPNAAEPLGLRSGETALIGRTVDELADAAVRVLRDEALARALAAEGHRWALEHLAPGPLAARLERQSLTSLNRNDETTA
jgi:glycosyltransferase involved in cell wall biosynthesis